MSSFDLSRWALGVKVYRDFISVPYSMFLSTRDRPDLTNSDAPGLLGSNTRVVLTEKVFSGSTGTLMIVRGNRTP